MYPVNFASKLLALQASREKTKVDSCIHQWRTMSSKTGNSGDDAGSNRGSSRVANAAFAANSYVEDMYKLWNKDHRSVHPSWDAYFREVTSGNNQAKAPDMQQSYKGSNKIDKEKIIQFVDHPSDDQQSIIIQIDIFEQRISEDTVSVDKSFVTSKKQVASPQRPSSPQNQSIAPSSPPSTHSKSPHESAEVARAKPGAPKSTPGNVGPAKRAEMKNETIADRRKNIKTDQPKSVQAKVEPPISTPAKTDPPKKVEARFETPKPAPAKVEATKRAETKVEPPKSTPAKIEPPNRVQAKVEPPKSAPASVEPAKKVVRKVEVPRSVPPKVDPSKKVEQAESDRAISKKVKVVEAKSEKPESQRREVNQPKAVVSIEKRLNEFQKAAAKTFDANTRHQSYVEKPTYRETSVPMLATITMTSWEEHVNQFRESYLELTKEERLKYPDLIVSARTHIALTSASKSTNRPDMQRSSTIDIDKPQGRAKKSQSDSTYSVSGRSSSNRMPASAGGGGAGGGGAGGGGGGGGGMNTNLAHYLAVHGVIRNYQARGHLIAHLDPLGIRNKGLTTLEERKGKVPGKISRQYVVLNNIDPNTKFTLPSTTFIGQGETSLPFGEIIKRLEEAYCNHIGVEFMYIHDMEQSLWIREFMETPANNILTKEEKIRTLRRLVRAVRFEQFLHRKYPGEKRFGLEGGEAMIPSVQVIIDIGSELGLDCINVAMAHRGRLNFLANVCEKPLKNIFSTFEAVVPAEPEMSGDVKYHLGTVTIRELENKKKFRVGVVPNPSHLETSGPVTIGKTRCEQFMFGDSTGDKSLSLLMHGDASFSGQGIVYEGINMSYLPCYTTHGTIHYVINNQVGFTTDPRFSRSAYYCTDVGRVSMAPIVHVNGDDVEAVIKASKLAINFRQKFKKDVIIDLICYRRNGHNELDEPMFTQPLMYQVINKQPNIEQIYVAQLIKEGVVTQADVDQFAKEYDLICEKDFALKEEIKTISSADWNDTPWDKFSKKQPFTEMPKTGIAKELLIHMATVYTTPPPADFELHKGIKRLFKNRANLLAAKDTDWAFGEALAYGSLMKEGYHVRHAGQDVERGTFSHRHTVLHHQTKDKTTFTMFTDLFPNQAPFIICNSPLSEYAVLGYEMGYSQVSPHILALWEAQFGDFANTAQAIIDCYLCSGEAKWGKQCGLVVLLPHGLEGMGPEHSSARVERLLQLCDDDVLTSGPFDSALSLRQLETCNWIVANCSVPANLFHILRRQMHLPFRKPLMLMIPKSTLRTASSPFADYLTGTQFLPVIPDAGPASTAPDGVKHLVFTCGHTYYYLRDWVKEGKVDGKIAVVRVEQLSPFPYEQIAAQIKFYKNAKVHWAQEEHKNQGGWIYMHERITAANDGKPCYYLGRAVSSAPATGNKVQFKNEVEAFKKSILTLN